MCLTFRRCVISFLVTAAKAASKASFRRMRPTRVRNLRRHVPFSNPRQTVSHSSVFADEYANRYANEYAKRDNTRVDGELKIQLSPMSNYQTEEIPDSPGCADCASWSRTTTTSIKMRQIPLRLVRASCKLDVFISRQYSLNFLGVEFRSKSGMSYIQGLFFNQICPHICFRPDYCSRSYNSQ